MPKTRRIAPSMVPDKYYDHASSNIASAPYGLLQHLLKHRYLGPKVRASNKHIGRSVSSNLANFRKIKSSTNSCSKGQAKVRFFPVTQKDVTYNGQTFSVPHGIFTSSKSACRPKATASQLRKDEKEHRNVETERLIGKYRSSVGKRNYQRRVARKNAGILGGFM